VVVQPVLTPPPAPNQSASGSQANATLPSGATPRKPDQLPAALAYVAARPIHEALPNLPLDIRGMVTSEAEVQVKVQIDEFGRVVRVDTHASTGPVSRFLVSATQEAARLWRFAPTMRENQPVASEMVLIFHYRPKTAAN
jgi:outer membrane biosynthesis protein TonB